MNKPPQYNEESREAKAASPETESNLTNSEVAVTELAEVNNGNERIPLPKEYECHKFNLARPNCLTPSNPTIQRQRLGEIEALLKADKDAIFVPEIEFTDELNERIAQAKTEEELADIVNAAPKNY
jgi:hypothetical protein